MGFSVAVETGIAERVPQSQQRAVLRPAARILPLALLALAGCEAAPAPSVPLAQPAPAPHAKHPVVVTLVVDQLAAWVAAERWPLLPADGGFARLRREGTYVRALRYEHAVTDTAPGHSALYTGAVPAKSGIFANEALGDDGKPESILRDSTVRVLTSDGPIDRAGSSLAKLKVETLADRLRAEHADAVILSFSLKDRGALFAAGRHPTAALWLDTTDNRFVTSSAVATAFPSWAGSFAAEALGRAEASTWELLDPAWVKQHAVTPDAQTGEGDLPGYGVVFPHPLGAVQKKALAFRTSPFADDVLFMLGLYALRAEHAEDHPTLLALSLSANDYIGHTFGPDSWEAWDEIRRLDQSLARFLSVLDAYFGADGYSVLLSGDHGTTPMPEVGRHAYCDTVDPWKRACGPTFRMLSSELGDQLKVVARNAVGPGEWVNGVSDPYVYLSPVARALEPARRAVLRDAVRNALRSTPGVAAVYDLAEIPTVCPPFADESLDALVCRSVAPAARERGAELYIVLSPGSFFDASIVVGKGTSHGSPYLFDRTVPMLARVPGRGAARVIESAPFDAFVRTAAEALGIDAPRDASSGPPILPPRVTLP